MRWNQIQVKSRGAIGMVKGWLGHMARLVFVARTVVTVSLRGGVRDVAESGSIESDGSALFTGIACMGCRSRVESNWTWTKERDSMTLCSKGSESAASGKRMELYEALKIANIFIVREKDKKHAGLLHINRSRRSEESEFPVERA